MRRMILGMLLCSVAFFTSGLLQLAIDKRTTSGSITYDISTSSNSEPDNMDHMGLFILTYPNEKEKKISILWQVPQYVIMSAAEVAFSVTGSKFAYSQAPVSMKSVVQAIWLLTSAAGFLLSSFYKCIKKSGVLRRYTKS
jgi:dipeptide/tripeptide permease